MSLDSPKSGFDRIVDICLNAGGARVLAISALMVGITALADYRVGLDISLGILYILPMVLAATVLKPPLIIVMAGVCAVLRGLFENPRSYLEIGLRFAFATLSYAAAGLFVGAVMRNREEQALRAKAEEQLKILVDSSPAGILTLDKDGVVLAANRAANAIFGFSGNLGFEGKSIKTYLPVLSDALRMDSGIAPFRTAVQSQGHRENGGMFLADSWFSTYPSPQGRRLAAIVIDSSEELREREEQILRQLSMNSRIMAGAMLHEVRNLCAAISAVYSNMADKCAPTGQNELQALDHLVQGLARIASVQLDAHDADSLEVVPLKEVLDDLRIIIEPSWAETGGTIRWEMPAESLSVVGDRHGLLQVLLNLAQNSQRAVLESSVRELMVSTTTCEEKVWIRIRDSGCGVAEPKRLFQPFQAGATSTGLGLYISRSLMRSYGGELRFEPQERGSLFTVELLRIGRRKKA